LQFLGDASPDQVFTPIANEPRWKFIHGQDLAVEIVGADQIVATFHQCTVAALAFLKRMIRFDSLGDVLRYTNPFDYLVVQTKDRFTVRIEDSLTASRQKESGLILVFLGIFHSPLNHRSYALAIVRMNQVPKQLFGYFSLRGIDIYHSTEIVGPNVLARYQVVFPRS